MYFVSQVGLQPAAVAVALKAAAQHPSIHLKGGLLLASGRTMDAAKRIATWAKRELSLDVAAEEWTASLSTDDLAVPVAKLRKWLEGTSHPSAPVVFNGSAGLKSLVIAMAHELRDRAWFLFPQADRLYLTRPGSSEWTDRVLPSLGLDVLLTLYGLDRSTAPPPPRNEIAKLFRRERLRIPPGVEEWLTIANGSRPVVLDLAYEARGVLHALVYVKDMADARALRRQHLDLNGLKPRWKGVCRGADVAAHLRESGIPPIDLHARSALADLQHWLDNPLPGQVPGPARISVTEPPQVRTIMMASHECDTGSPTDLAVCLGNDPTPTLLSIWTHRPDTALVFYDFKTPAVVECAQRLEECAQRREKIGSLPTRRLVLIPTDVLGRGIAEAVPLGAERPLRLDVTPGSKPQGWSLTRLTATVPGSEVWVLRGDRQVASTFGDPARELPMQGPPLAILGEACGGALKGSARKIVAKDPFWQLLGLVLRKHQEAGGAFGSLDEMLAGPQIQSHVSVEPTGHDRSAGGSLKVTVSLDGKSATKRVDKPKDGYWFERLVADAFLRAGADEVVASVRWSFRDEMQQFLEAKHRGPVHKDDVDVAARFGTRTAAISCKARRELKPHFRSEIEALAEQKFGRFCLPILADLALGRASSVVPSRGCAHVDLALLSDPPALRRWLDQVFAARSTI